MVLLLVDFVCKLIVGDGFVCLVMVGLWFWLFGDDDDFGKFVVYWLVEGLWIDGGRNLVFVWCCCMKFGWCGC